MSMMKEATAVGAHIKYAKYKIGQAVRHRVYPLRGVIFDVDPEFNNTEEWLQSIPEDIRPKRDQPFYRLFAETAQLGQPGQPQHNYIAYVSEQNLVRDESGTPVHHPAATEWLARREDGGYVLRKEHMN